MISIVSGTFSRLASLQKMVQSVRDACANIEYEIILVDGGSRDGTEAWCLSQPDIVFIQQRERLGAVKAFNAGFQAAKGDYVVNLNDDCFVVGNIFEQAISQFEESRVGQVAFPFKDPCDASPKCEKIYLGNPRRDWLYANFGMTRLWLGRRLGWWGDYHTYGGDTCLSVKIWDAGYRVVKLNGNGYVEHLRLEDDTRRENTDSHRFFARWEQWGGAYPEPRVLG